MEQKNNPKNSESPPTQSNKLDQQNKVSVIIVNYNGKKWLEKCLTSITNQTYKNYEVIFVDNNSTDDSVNYVKQNFKQVKLIENDHNGGFAEGNNLGIKHATGEYIILLNNDTYVEKDYIEKFVKVFVEFPNCGVAQSKIVLMNEPKKLDIACTFWPHTTMLYYEGLGDNSTKKRYQEPKKMFSVKGASMIFRKNLADKIGLFDESFWAYYEETDFCHRCLVWGYDIIYYPKTTCYHAGGKTAEMFAQDYIQFHNFKNKLASYIHNFQFRYLIVYVPIFTVLTLGIFSIMFALNKKFWLTKVFYKSYWWNIKNLRNTLRYRKEVQKYRKVNDSEYLKEITRHPPLKYYLALANGNLEGFEYE